MVDYETVSLLEGVFGERNVAPEWDVAKESEDALQRKLHYCPRIDFAIKPLNIDSYVNYNNQLINEAYENHLSLLDELKGNGLVSSRWNPNENPRCFLAIEYENKTSTKHRLGSLINAGAIGKIGILVALNAKVYRSYDRIFNYLEFLQQHKKLDEIQTNLLVIRKEKFEDILKTAQEQ